MLNFAKDLAAALDALRRHAILFLLGVTLIALALLGRSWLDAHDASLTPASHARRAAKNNHRRRPAPIHARRAAHANASANLRRKTKSSIANSSRQRIATSRLAARQPQAQRKNSPIANHHRAAAQIRANVVRKFIGAKCEHRFCSPGSRTRALFDQQLRRRKSQTIQPPAHHHPRPPKNIRGPR